MKFRLIPAGLALTATTLAYASFTPIPLTSDSFTRDMVVESNALPVLTVVTTASVDNGTNNTANTWFEQGYDTANPANGLPPAGSVIVAISNANYSFRMPPTYAGPNGILIDTVVPSGTFTLTTPAAYSLLSFLGSGGNGGDVIGVKVHHADGTFEVGQFGCPDWFGGTLNVAHIAGGRCQSTVAFTTETDGDNPRLYFRDIVLTNTTSPVTTVDLSYVSGLASSHNDILALSGATTSGGAVAPIVVSGYDYDFVVEASAPKRARVITADGVNTATTATIETGDGNTGFTFYELGHNYNNLNNGPVNATNVAVIALARSTGLPAAGSTVMNAAGDRTYQLPPSYTANNAALLSASVPTTTLTFVSPSSAAGLSFLATAGNGGGYLEIVAHHQDAFLETNTVYVPDWFNTSLPYVLGSAGRVAAESGQWSRVADSAKLPYIFNCDAVLLQHPGSPIISVDLNNTNTGTANFAIFALSGTAVVPPIFTTQPTSVLTNNGVTVSFSAPAVANATITYQWQKGTNGVFVNLANGGNVSGATTETLVLSNVGASDEAAYRMVATNVEGASTSSAATLTVLSPLPAVTVPGDSITAYGPGANEPNEGVRYSIDSTTHKYLSFGNGSTPPPPVGFIVSPSKGPTIVSVIRFYTANDAPERDPADYVIEGSNDGGASYSLIASNLVSLPDGRNNADLPLAPLTQFMTQVRLANTVSYTTYRVYFTKLKGTANLMQIGEVEMLGTVDTSRAFFSSQPTSVTVFDSTSASLTATASGTPTPTLRWFKGTNHVYVPLIDGGNIAGSQTGNLIINPASFGDIADYIAVATNPSGSVTSAVAKVTVLINLPNVLAATDTITHFGDSASVSNTWGAVSAPTLAIDQSTGNYVNGGHGLNAEAHFPPFGGPVGLIVTHLAPDLTPKPTLVSALRIFTGDGNAERDPADYTLEGSSDAGATWTLISSGALSLPNTRNASGQSITDQSLLTMGLQEVRFNNKWAFTSYRLTFNHTRDDNAAIGLELSEVQLPGVEVTTTSPAISIHLSGGGLTITSPVAGTLQSNTSLANPAGWVNVQAVTANTPVTITPTPGVNLFYRVKVL